MKISNFEKNQTHYERRVALGVFDGVHLGHQRLIEKATLVMTFNPHPQVITHAYCNEIKLLTTLEEKQSLIPNLIVLHFTPEIASLGREDFVREILVKELAVDTVITGYDYMFGKGRSGHIVDLTQMGEQYGFKLEVVDKFEINGTPVKSSLIRKLVAEGNIQNANLLLGRPYFMFGQIIHGKGLGRTLGFPTVNIMVPPDKLIPALGVYGGHIQFEGQRYQCAINVGLVSRDLPDTDPTNVIVEAHIFSFNQDVYGKKANLTYAFFHRPIRQFSSLDELKTQIAMDVESIKYRFSTEKF